MTTANNNLRMSRCPICGGSARTDTAWNEERINGTYGVFAICRSCGAKTPTCRSMAEAVAEWNEGNISKNGENLRLNLFDSFG